MWNGAWALHATPFPAVCRLAGQQEGRGVSEVERGALPIILWKSAEPSFSGVLEACILGRSLRGQRTPCKHTCPLLLHSLEGIILLYTQVAAASHRRLFEASSDAKLPAREFEAHTLSLWHTPEDAAPSLSSWSKEGEFSIV